MKNFSKFLAAAAAILVMASCGQKAAIDGKFASSQSCEVIVKLLDVNRYKVLDTLTVNKDGAFSYKMDMQKGHPEFVYLFDGDKKLAGLLLEAGDRVSVIVDSLGSVSIEGSEESLKLAQVEAEHAAVLSKFALLDSQLALATDDQQVRSISMQMSKEYVRYYRDRVSYIMHNSKSLTSVNVLYQYLGANLPLFAQNTDAVHFTNIADSLETVYPDSKYVKALRKEAEKRFGYLELQSRLENAEEIGYPDIELPDIDAKKIKLSSVESKVVLIYFWTASEPSQNVFNVEVLKPLYEEYHSRGFEIYQVSLDVDKSLWATTVKGQNLPWINVCDARGEASPYVGVYNIPTLPAAYVLAAGELIDGGVTDTASFRKLLERHL